MRRPVTAPINTEPTKMRIKEPVDEIISCPGVRPSTPYIITVSYMTSAIASLKIDSPNTIANRFSSAFISLKMANTETGSVAEMRLPNAKLSFHENASDQEVYPTA